MQIAILLRSRYAQRTGYANTIELPDDIVNQLQPVNLSHRILELIVADRYRQGHVGAAEVRRILNFASRWET